MTDEQIAMFRHSEIQALLRERRRAEERKAVSRHDHNEAAGTKEGELEDDQDTPAPWHELPQPVSGVEHLDAATSKAKRQKAGRKKRGDHKQPLKPDLRKRTWDRVDRGLESLDYGEEDNAAQALQAAPQRRKISYEDV